MHLLAQKKLAPKKPLAQEKPGASWRLPLSNWTTLTAAALVSGCSTVSTLMEKEGEEQPTVSYYSGTKLNSSCLLEHWDDTTMFCVIDYPLSLIGDTLAIPYVYIEKQAPSPSSPRR